jgi:hypothetical protein
VTSTAWETRSTKPLKATIDPISCRFTDLRHGREISNMPTTVNLYAIGVWFCVGFFTGSGWALGAWLVGRVLGHL